MSPNALAQHCHQLIQRGQAGQAVPLLNDGVRNHPANAVLWHLLGIAQRTQGDFEGAVEALERASELAPNPAEILNTLGNTFKSIAEHEKAEKAYRKAVSSDLNYQPALSNLFALHIADRNSHKAREVLTQWQAAYPTAIECVEAEGELLRLEKKFAQANEKYKNVLENAPQRRLARFGLAQSLLEMGEFSSSLQASAPLDDGGSNTDKAVLHQRATALSELDRYDEAEQYLRRGVQVGCAAALKDYSNFLWMSGQQATVQELLQAAVSAASFRPDQALSAIDQMIELDMPESARSAFQSLPQTLQAHPTFQTEYASVLCKLGEPEQAFQIVEKLVSGVRQTPRLGYFEVATCLMTGRYELALERARKWRKAAPLDQHWITLEADALRMLGRENEYRKLYNFENLVRPLELPIPDGFTSVDDFNTAFATEIVAPARFAQHPIGQSARSGVQNPLNIGDDASELVRAYVQALEEPISTYLGSIGNDQAHPLTARNTGQFFINGIWSISLKAGGRHVSHVHPNGWISSAYYVAVPPEVDEADGRAGWIKFGEPAYTMPDPAPAEHWVKPQAGVLVLFPAYMWHGTQPISGRAPRITAPLDVLPGERP